MDLDIEFQRGPSLRRQLEHALRAAIRAGKLQAGASLPPSRALAEQLGVSRGVVVDSYAQLVAEGYLSARQGSGTRVAKLPAPWGPPEPRKLDPPGRFRYELRPGLADFHTFPRARWQAALFQALRDLRCAADLLQPGRRGRVAQRDRRAPGTDARRRRRARPCAHLLRGLAAGCGNPADGADAFPDAGVACGRFVRRRGRIAAMRPLLPAGVHALGEAGGTESLHDARFIGVGYAEGRLVIRAEGYLWGRGYPMDRAAFVQSYDGAEPIGMPFTEFEQVTSDERCEILYCEFDEFGDGRFEHRMLFWPADLGEIAIAFQNAEVEVTPLGPVEVDG